MPTAVAADNLALNETLSKAADEGAIDPGIDFMERLARQILEQ